jgi:hypothetical protein
MKINVDIDCTPDEARALVGLPDVKPMQQALMQDIENRMRKALSAMEPDSLFKMWLPAGMQGLEEWQKFVWSRLTGATGRKDDKKGRTDAEGGKA